MLEKHWDSEKFVQVVRFSVSSEFEPEIFPGTEVFEPVNVPTRPATVIVSIDTVTPLLKSVKSNKSALSV